MYAAFSFFEEAQVRYFHKKGLTLCPQNQFYASTNNSIRKFV
jgi:hypothetical protein